MKPMVRSFTGAVLLAVAFASTLWAGDEQTPLRVFVVNTQDASVSLVDLEAMKEVRRFPVGPRPYGIALSPDGRTVAVGVEDEEKVKFFDAADFRLKGEVPIGKMHHDHIVLTQDGKHVLVANFYSDDVVAIDITKMKEAYRIEGTSAPHVVKYGPLKQYAYVTCKKITGIAIIDPAGRKLVKFHQINVNPRSLTLSPDESKVYLGSFWVDGFFEMQAQAGKVTRLFALEPPPGNRAPQEVTYHGVEAVGANLVAGGQRGALLSGCGGSQHRQAARPPDGCVQTLLHRADSRSSGCSGARVGQQHRRRNCAGGGSFQRRQIEVPRQDPGGQGSQACGLSARFYWGLLDPSLLLLADCLPNPGGKRACHE